MGVSPPPARLLGFRRVSCDEAAVVGGSVCRRTAELPGVKHASVRVRWRRKPIGHKRRFQDALKTSGDEGGCRGIVCRWIFDV